MARSWDGKYRSRNSCPVGGSGNDSHMLAGTGSGEEKLVLVEPGQSGGIAQEKVRVAAEHRNRIGEPSGKLQNGIGDLRAIGRERQIVFQTRVVGEAPGFAVGEHLDVDLIGRQEAAAAADERDHAAVRRQSRS